MQDEMNGADVDFFLITTPGFEDLTVRELRDWLPEVLAVDVGSRETGSIVGPVVERAIPVIERGGVSFKCDLATGLALNTVMKTPTRILLRMAVFGCRDFPRLFRKMAGLPWNTWVEEGQPVEFHVSTHGSRLKMKKRIEETCRAGRQAFLKERERKELLVKRGEPVTVFVRLLDDVCTISLDTSGELLHKRGLRPLSSEAPLRETIAASLLLLLEGAAPIGDGVEVELIDPMTGGGTFLMEAAVLHSRVMKRFFAFECCEPLLKRAGPLPDLNSRRRNVFRSFIGVEAARKTLTAARANMEGLKKDQGLTSTFALLGADFLKLDHPGFIELEGGGGSSERWVIVNPPYGERIRVEGRLSDFYANLLAQVERLARPARACFLLSAKVSREHLRVPRTWRLVEERRFLNGGIPVVAWVFVRN